jgi:hypothetical protein
MAGRDSFFAYHPHGEDVRGLWRRRPSCGGVARSAHAVPRSKSGDDRPTNLQASLLDIRANTDGHGHYALRDLNPGQYTIRASAGEGTGGHASKEIALNAGQSVDSADFHLRGQGEISGKVLDQNKDPLPGIAVFLVAREYSLGELRYVFASMADTDDQGEYHLRRAEPGRAYLIMAGKARHQLEAISDIPVNPKSRKPAFIPTGFHTLPAREARAGSHCDLRSWSHNRS